MTETAANNKSLRVVIIFSDGIRGHVNQSRGIANWLAELSGAEIFEIEIPKASGLKKTNLKRKEQIIKSGKKSDAIEWINLAGGEKTAREVGAILSQRQIKEGSQSVLFISAGNSAAPFSLALSSIWRCRCATIMTPSPLGTECFDFAIVPEHDCPPERPNILATVGSPNLIRRETLEEEATELLMRVHPTSDRIWSILIGGDDANYKISADWIKKNIGLIIHLAEQEDIDLYITTSRRTNDEAVKMLRKLAEDTMTIRYLLIANEDPFNPIPAMLGFSEEMFCTEDSVNMVSEIITGGVRAILMRVEHKKGIKYLLQNVTDKLIKCGGLSPTAAWGIPKFDRVFERFERNGLLVEFSSWLKDGKTAASEFNLSDTSGIWNDFNEARRAAKWILDNMDKKNTR